MNDFRSSQDGIAVIGVSCRFPMANNQKEFWDNLCRGKECISRFTEKEVIRENGEEYRAILKNPDYVPAGGVIDNIDLFDADFFSFNPNEAENMDPQHRLFLTCSWEAMEDAGYYEESGHDRVGVFAGSSISTYFLNNLFFRDRFDTAKQMMLLQGNDKDHLAPRVSYKMNLTGPSVNIQNACSTSLVAVHQACQSILNGECDLALAGGVSLRLPQKSGYLYQNGNILSPDGHCKAFDVDAKGTVFGNGVGVVVLKSMDKALADRDNIYAVIKGTAINNDGNYKIGYTAPSEQGQTSVVAEALEISGVTPNTIDYIEAHGTGTPLGDAIELNALNNAFKFSPQKRVHCAVGSVKSNIGHLDRAAGIAGLIKVVLALKYKKIPPILHCQTPNSQLAQPNSPFYVNTELKEWTKDKGRRRAGVSSFGIGGTNVHAVLEEAPVFGERVSEDEKTWKLLTLSAKTRSSLDNYSAILTEFLKNKEDFNLSDAAFTLQVGRKSFAWRKVVLCRSAAEAMEAMKSDEKTSVYGSRVASEASLIFCFAGQIPFLLTQVKDLYEKEPCLTTELEHCSEILKEQSNVDLISLLEGWNMGAGKVESPAIVFLLEYILAKFLMNLGATPYAVIGRGLGEYTAACISGALSLEEAVRRISTGAKLEQDLKFSPGEIPCILEPSSEEVRNLIERESINFIEFGRRNLITEINSAAIIPVFSSKDQKGMEMDGVKSLLDTLGRLWLSGAEIHWERLGFNQGRCRISLPNYQWDMSSYWVEPSFSLVTYKKSDKKPKATLHKRPDLLAEYQAPGTAIERMVAETWQEIFRIENIGVHDDFFELGGHSLMATQLASRLSSDFGIEVSLQELFQATTIYEIAKKIEEILIKEGLEEQCI
jgi:acyl transferase domain-containing protein